MQGDEAKEGTGSGGADRLAELQARVERLSNLFAQLEGAKASARRTRAGVVILLLIVVLGYGLVLYTTLNRLSEKEYQQELMAAVMQRMHLVALDVRRELGDMSQRLGRLYLDEVKKQAPDAWAEIQVDLKKEAATFKENALGIVQDKFDPMLKNLATRQEQQVRDAFSIKDDKILENVMDNLTVALQGATHDVLEEKFGRSQERYMAVTNKVIQLLPEDRRDKFLRLADQWWTSLLLDQLKGLEMTRTTGGG